MPIFYLVIIFIWIILSFFKNDKIHVLVSIVLFGMIILSGFRYNVGVDYGNYEIIYTRDIDGYLSIIEPAWSVFDVMLHEANFSFVGWTLLTSVLIIGGFYVGISRMSINICDAFVVFCATPLFDTSFNAVRQYVAMSIVFFASCYILQKKCFYYYIAVLFALLFHYSALVALIIPLFYRKINKSIWVILLLTTLLFGTPVMNYVLNVLSSWVSQLVSFTNRTYGYDADSFSAGIGSGLLQYVYNSIALILLFLYKYIRKKEKNDNILFFLNLFLFSICIYNVFYTFQVYRRMYEYFFMYIVLLLPVYKYVLKYPVNRIVFFLIIFVFVCFLMNSVWDQNYQMRFDLFNI